VTKAEAYSRGFDRGNYGNAYESRDWDSWYSENCGTPSEFAEFADAYRAGLLLGFFASYEITEIGDDGIAETVDELRKEWGDE
jgi:hypothetical protein